MLNKRDIGAGYENLAIEFMKGEGMQILEQNFRCRSGEIDIIARDKDGTYVFTEVKYRKTLRFGLPEEAVSAEKQRRIRRVAQFFILKRNLKDDASYRFDVAAIDGSGRINYYRDAYGGI